MLRSTCCYFLFIVFVNLSWCSLCDSRNLGTMEKKLSVNLDHLITKNNEKITKLEAPLTRKTKTLSSQAHVIVNHDDINGQLNGKTSKDDRHRIKRGLLVKTVSSQRVSRTWKAPKYSKRPKSDQEHSSFDLDYMKPTTHPPHHN